jgi:hypothetical protein
VPAACGKVDDKAAEEVLVKRQDSSGSGCALALGCALLLACSSDSTGGTQRPGAPSGATGPSGAVGASNSGSPFASGSSSTSTAPGSGNASGTTPTTGWGAQGGTGAGIVGAEGDGATADAGQEEGQASWDSQVDAADSGGVDSGFPPITECSQPSVDRLEVWTSSGPAEGTTIPPTGNLLVMAGGRYVAKVQFLNVEWHVCPVYLGNQFNANANLSASSGFVLTYSSTSDMYVQARPTSHWSGGTQWATPVPSTGGVKKSQFFSFDPVNWKSLFGTPTWSFADTLKEVLGFVFVGQTPNTITFYGLRFDGYVPPCL